MSRNLIKTIPLLPILLYLSIFFAFFFRFYNIWLSDFQGDEVVAHAFLIEKESFIQFLLTELKGPGQYLVAKLTYSFFSWSTVYEAIARIPFVLAGFLTVIIIYKITKSIYNFKIAVFAVFFSGLSGHLATFSRLVQYQGFVMLTAASSIFLTIKYLKNSGTKLKFPIMAGITSGIGLLFHYNSLSYILPIALILFWYKHFKTLFAYTISAFTVASMFYIPYVLNPSFSKTINYLYYDRISANFYYDSILYEIKLLFIYHPKEYMVLLSVGVVTFALTKLSKNFTSKILLLLFFAIAVTRYTIQISKTSLIRLDSLIFGLFILDFLLKNKSAKPSDQVKNLITLWFLFCFFAFIVFINKPLGSIFALELPMSIIAAIGIYTLYKKFPRFIVASTIIAFIASISFNYQTMINPNNSYPHKETTYIFGRMYSKMARGEEIFRSVNGFMYKRDLGQAHRDLIELSANSGINNFMGSNEKVKTIQFYSRGLTNIPDQPGYYLYVKNSRDGKVDPYESLVPVIEKENYKIYLINE